MSSLPSFPANGNKKTVHEYANAYHRLGLSVIPILRDGTRKPPLKWKQYQAQLSTDAERAAWYGQQEPYAIGVVCGAISGNLEVIDFDADADATFAAFSDVINADGFGLMDALTVSRTPRGGYHIWYKCPDATIGGNQKLAFTETGKTLIETRAEGGYVVAPGSPLDCHETGRPYQAWRGDPAHDLPSITPAERERLLSVARSLDRTPTVSRTSSPLILRATSAPSSIERAKAYIAKADPAISGQGGHAHTFALVRAVAYGFDLSEADAMDVLAPWNATCAPPWTDAELLHKIRDANTKPYDRPRGYLLHETPHTLPTGPRPIPDLQMPIVPRKIMSMHDLLSKYPTMRPPVIDGLIREGETMNVIASTKTGKSWMVISLCLAVATGKSWHGFPTRKGKVLVVDNELHPETLSSRLRRVAEAYGCLEECRHQIDTLPLRGGLQDLTGIGAELKDVQTGEYAVIVIDAWYRAIPINTSENDNAAVAGLYNTLDLYAERLGCCFVLIHHTTKGLQNEKGVTDVGAGAGSQSRAADTHLVLRPHKEDNAVVLEGAVRSFPPIEPKCLRWRWPFFTLAPDLDPADLRGRRDRTGKAKAEQATPAEPTPPPEPWTAQRFADTFASENPQSRDAIILNAQSGGIGTRTAKVMLDMAIDSGILHVHKSGTKVRISKVAQTMEKTRRKRRPKPKK